MKGHIGNLIKKKVKESGLSITNFAKAINCSRRNAYTIFERESIDTMLLTKIGEVLDYNFFQFFLPEETQNILNEPRDIYNSASHKMEELEKENSYLKEINELLKSKLKEK